MPSPELAKLLEILRRAPMVQGDTFEAMRRSTEEATAATKLPPDVKFEGVDAGGVAAEWVRTPESSPDHVVLYFHGGGYAIGSPRTCRSITSGIGRAARIPVLSVDYRLAPEHPFPAALHDALAAWDWLGARRLEASRIAVAGDSAGGGLAVALLLALRDQGRSLPGAGVCISPWLDMTLTGATMESKLAEDPVCTADLLARMSAAYVGRGDARAPLASPVFADPRGLPPLLLQVGSSEILLDDSRRLAARARQAGVDVDLEEWEGMVHIWHTFVGFLPESQRALDRIGAFLRSRLA